MLTSAFAKFAIFFTGVFGTTLGTTLTITRIQEKIRFEQSERQNKEDEENDEDEEEEIVYTHLDYFIEALTNLNYLDAQIDAEINVNDTVITLNGDLSLNLDISDLTKTEALVNLNVNYDSLSEDIKITYINSTIYLEALNQHLKMATTSISEVVELVSSFNIPIDLPPELVNIDVNDLLNRLGQMKVTEYSNQLTYEFNLFDNHAPIIFTSDLDHKLTSLKTKGLALGDISITLDGQTKVCDDRRAVVSPKGENTYTDITGYFGILRDISGILNKKQFAANFVINAEHLNHSALTFDGHVDVDYQNLDIALSSNIKAENMDVDLIAYYISDKNIYLNYDNRLKFKYAQQNLLDLIDLIKEFIDQESLDIFLDNFASFSLPIIDLIKDGKYLELLDVLDIKLLGNQIVIALPNSLMFGGDELITVTLDSTREQIVDLSVSNLLLEDYIFNFCFTLDEYVAPDLPSDIDNYQDLAPVNNIVDFILKQSSRTQFAFGINGSLTPIDSDTPKAEFNGSTQFDLENAFGGGRIVIDDDRGVTHNVAIDVYDIPEQGEDIDETDAKSYFVYNEKLKGTFNLNKLKGLFNLIVDFVNSDNPRWKQYFDVLLSSPIFTMINAIKNGEYEKMLIDDLIESMTISDSSLSLRLNGKLFNQESGYLEIELFYSNYEITSLSINGTLYGYDLSLNLNAQKYNPDYPKLDINDDYTDFSDIEVLAEHLLKTAELDIFHLTGNVELNVSVIGFNALSGDATLDLYVDIDENEKVYVAGSLKNIPTLVGVNADLPFCSDRDCYFYYDGSSDPDYVYIYAEQEEITYDSGKYAKVNSKDFGIDILQYICGVGLGLSDSIIEDIGGGEERTTPIRFEEVLKSYAFNREETKWDLSLNLNELANDDVFNDLNVTIQGDEEGYLSNAHIETGLSVISVVGITVKLDAALDRNNPQFPWVEFSSYIANHINDEDGKVYSFTR
ncbi:MAG: hypothetical protein MJ213_04885 [Bacilli bacterium]|nr:hypothetical protein [Bacilli bacterium]